VKHYNFLKKGTAYPLFPQLLKKRTTQSPPGSLVAKKFGTCSFICHGTSTRRQLFYLFI